MKAPPPQPNVGGPTAMPKPILIVDDNADEIELLVHFLRRKGVSNPIHVVRDGLAAIDYLYGLEPHSNRQTSPFPGLIFLDINMPRASGYEVLEWLQAHPEIPAPKLLVWTSAPGENVLKKCSELGANSFLLKSSLETEFGELVRRYPDIWQFADPTGQG